MSDPYYQQNNPYQYDQPSAPAGQYPPSGQYPQQPPPYSPAGQYQQPAGVYPPSMPLQQGYPQQYAQPFVYAQPVYVQTAVESSGWATASLVCSLLGFVVPLTPLLGVIFGHIALSQINRSGGQVGGKGLAISGLIIGYILLALEVFGVCFFLLALGSLQSVPGATTGLAPIFR